MKKFIMIGYGIGIIFGLYMLDVFLNLLFYVENIHSEVLYYSSINSSSNIGILAFSLFFMGILFIISVFQAKFYVKNPDDQLPLYYTIYCWVVFAIFGATIFPYGNWMTVLDFVYVFTAIAFIVFHYYIHAYLNKQPNTYFTWGIWIIAVLFMGGSSFAGIQSSILIVPYFSFVGIIYLMYVIYLSYRKLSEGTIQVKGNFFCVIILIICNIHNFFIEINVLDGTSMKGFGMFLFFILHSTINTERFLTTYSQTIQMKRLLEMKVNERTEELELTNKEMQRIELEKSQIISNICHDLANPITSIRIVSQGLIDDILSRDEQQYYEEIYHQSCLMENLVNDLRQLNMLESNQLSFQMNEVDWFDFMEKLFKNYRGKLKSNQLSYTIQYEKNKDKTVKVEIDPLRLEQVFLNILSNSIKFTAEKGSIDVRIGVDAESQEAYFQVTDSGIGMLPDQLPKIFNRFYRTQSIRKDMESTGLGLSIVQNIIERHHGEIHIESEWQKGTTVTVKIPVLKPIDRLILRSG